MATISMHHVTSSLSAVRQRGGDVDRLLIRAGINPLVSSNSRRRIHTDQVARLFKLVQLELGDEFMGFTATACKVGAFKIMCDLVQHCQTLGELLEKAVEFYQLLTDDIVMDVVVNRNRAIFSVEHQRPDCDNEHFLREFLMVIWHRFPSWYLGEAIRLRETRFSFPKPAHHRELEIMFPGRLKFSQASNQLIYDAAYLDKPLVRTRAEVEYFVRNAPADVMTIPGIDNSLERQIERIIELMSPTVLIFPKLEEVAQKLDCSPQSLYRQLKAKGTSYQKIKDDIRRETAIKKLVNDNLSIEKVSALVGFSEPRSFTRAFGAWTGMSPQKYRKTFREN